MSLVRDGLETLLDSSVHELNESLHLSEEAETLSEPPSTDGAGEKQTTGKGPISAGAC